MSKFQVGDQVRIKFKKDVADPLRYQKGMEAFEDCVATIDEIDADGELSLLVNGLDTDYWWSLDEVELEGLTYSQSLIMDNSTGKTIMEVEKLKPQCDVEHEPHDFENIMDITRNMCRG